MEAKVDIRKLQLLNDRINQTLEALNQVRFTVHGLAHSSPYGQMNPMGMMGGSFGLGGQPFGPQSFNPQQSFGINPIQQGFVGGIGLQHTNPFNPYLNPIASQGYTGQGFTGPGVGGWGQVPNLQTSPFGYGNPIGVGGLFHSSPDVIERTWLEQRANDPNRIAFTFPYAMSPQSPVTIW